MHRPRSGGSGPRQRMMTFVKGIIYEIVDTVLRGRGVPRVISGEPIRFPSRWARFYPSVYEPEKFAFVRKHCVAGTTALDIGAHIGLFSVLMARCVGPSGRVLAFEPTPATRDVLMHTVQMNGCASVVEIHREAVAGSSGTATFYDTGTDISNSNSLVEVEGGRTLSVPTISIDELVHARDMKIGFLKIDAEGGELDILNGARATIARDRPFVQLEVHPRPLQQRGGMAALWRVITELALQPELDGRPLGEAAFMQLTDGIEIQLMPTSRQ